MHYTGVTSRYQRRRVSGNRRVTSVIAYTVFVQSPSPPLSLPRSISLSLLSLYLPIQRTIDKLGGQNHRVRTILRPFCVRGVARNLMSLLRDSTCQHYTVPVMKRERVLPHTPLVFTTLPSFSWASQQAGIKKYQSYELFMSFETS